MVCHMAQILGGKRTCLEKFIKKQHVFIIFSNKHLHIVKKAWVCNSKTKWNEKQNSSSPPNSATSLLLNILKNIDYGIFNCSTNHLVWLSLEASYAMDYDNFFSGFPCQPTYFPAGNLLGLSTFILKTKENIWSCIHFRQLICHFSPAPKYGKISEYFSESKFNIQLGWM